MTTWPPHFYFNKGLLSNYPEKKLQELKKIVSCCQKTGVPIIFTIKHLAKLLNMPFWLVYDYTRTNPYFNIPYKVYKVRKKSNTTRYRWINIPSIYLCRIQRWINKFILSKIKSSSFSYAFEEKRNIKMCAEMHIGCRWLIKFDIKNFFESITEEMVYYVFLDMGYSRLFSYELTRLCTKRLEPLDKNDKYHNCYDKKISQKFLKRNKWNISDFYSKTKGFLPQGAPTSPRIANLVMRTFDEVVGKWALNNHLVYTRYADDLFLSSNEMDFSRKNACDVKKKIYGFLRQFNFEPNYTKTEICSPKGKKIILGLIVEHNAVFLQKKFKRLLELHFFFCKKDLEKHTKEWKFDSVIGMYHYVKGLYSYANQIEPSFCKKIQRKYGRIEDIFSGIGST